MMPIFFGSMHLANNLLCQVHASDLFGLVRADAFGNDFFRCELRLSRQQLPEIELVEVNCMTQLRGMRNPSTANDVH